MKYFLYVLIITVITFGQSAETKKDSLHQNKQSVKQLNKNLRNEIDSLKILRDSLERKLRTELTELYILRYGKDVGGKVAMGQIWTGMTEEMMRDSWGEPDSISVNKQPWGRYSQYYYGDITYFFKDGKLFEWEKPKD
jgi:hypothetical protein